VSTPRASGRMSWTEAVAGPLAGTACLRQDLDGPHVFEAPETPPPASILWAWRAGSWLIRARLDGDTALVAVRDGAGLVRTVPWGADDGRVAASRDRAPSAGLGGVCTPYEQVVVDGADDGAAPIPFLRPA
jgi:hypothetical protein